SRTTTWICGGEYLPQSKRRSRSCRNLRNGSPLRPARPQSRRKWTCKASGRLDCAEQTSPPCCVSNTRRTDAPFATRISRSISGAPRTGLFSELAGRRRAVRFSGPTLLRRHHLRLLLAQSVDAEADDVAGLQPLRIVLHAVRDAGRCAGDDHVAGIHDEELRAIPDDMRSPEDHRPRRAVLARLAVDGEPQLQVLWILDLVLGDEPGAERTEILAALALDPLAGALDLEHALGNVV